MLGWLSAGSLCHGSTALSPPSPPLPGKGLSSCCIGWVILAGECRVTRNKVHPAGAVVVHRAGLHVGQGWVDFMLIALMYRTGR